MKKIFIIAALMLGFAFAVAAQPRAIGARLGSDLELSYQHGFGSNFLEADLGLGLAFHAVDLTLAYDFSLLPGSDFNIYVGPAVNLFAITETNGGIGAGIGAQLGLEYSFPSVPINLSLDWRPLYHFGGYGAYWAGAALGIRYRF